MTVDVTSVTSRRMPFKIALRWNNQTSEKVNLYRPENVKCRKGCIAPYSGFLHVKETCGRYSRIYAVNPAREMFGHT